jgi:thioester reductase-like protein
VATGQGGGQGGGHAEPGIEADDDLRARVTAVAARVLGHAVSPDEPIAAGVDSLAAAELLAALSDSLGREVPLAWWFEARTLGELALRLGRFAQVPTTTSAQVRADLALATPVARRSPPAAPVRSVLLTGATGFLGAHLVESLRARGADVVCLVRAADRDAAHARLAAALAAREIPIEVGDHVRAIAGDLASPALAGRHELTEGIDAIVHAGATVSWLASYAALRGPNVAGTHALVELAAAGGLPLHFVSTISTAPPAGDEDSRLGLDAVLSATPYALSKWIAEDHVRRAATAGLAAAIYRPAMIAGHSVRGVGNPEDFLHRYLVGCSELGLYVDLDDAMLDMTPVDFVAEAIAALVVSRPSGDAATYHLANVDQSLSFAAVGRALVAAGLAVAPASYPAFRAALAGHPTSRLHALAAFFPETCALGMGPWPCTRSVAVLAGLGIRRPPIDDAIIERYVGALVRRGLVRRG